jgi:hypothetical protein
MTNHVPINLAVSHRGATTSGGNLEAELDDKLPMVYVWLLRCTVLV